METIITSIKTGENYTEKSKIQFLMFSVLDASCQHICIYPSYTSALIYSSTTAEQNHCASTLLHKIPHTSGSAEPGLFQPYEFTVT